MLNKADAADADCAVCHNEYNQSVNFSMHNRTINANGPTCTDCHAGYLPVDSHTSGTNGTIVNKITCTKSGCHVQGQSGFDFGIMSSADCTQCHFANTTTQFSLNTSLYAHDHNNLTVEHNYYIYNQSGTIQQMPLRINGGVGVGLFPYYSCTLSCHGSSTSIFSSVDNTSKTWVNSAHAKSLVEPPLDQKISCAKCKSPLNYNASANQSALIPVPDWQGIQCRICHDIMNISYSNPTGGKPLAFYNGTASSLAGYPVYDQVHNATELCEKCHAGSSHDSKFAGTHKDVVGFTCADCHLNTTSVSKGGFNNKSHSFEVMNVYTGVTGCEVCHSVSDHNNAFQFTSNHTDKVTCEACHDKTVARNATGYAVSSANKNGLYLDSGEVSSWKGSKTSPSTWPLHNITRKVSCNKCHGTKSATDDQLLAPGSSMGCTDCHTSYGDAYNASKHNKVINANAPYCTDCHSGYVSGHTTGTTGFTVNGTNTCMNCHNNSVTGFDFGRMSSADCAQCHFPNTTQKFTVFNDSLYTHDDNNLTIEHNYYDYNQSGTIQMPLKSNGGVGEGQFPFWACSQSCHAGRTSNFPSLDNASITWVNSKHAQSSVEPGIDNNMSCAKCKSPLNYNESTIVGLTRLKPYFQYP